MRLTVWLPSQVLMRKEVTRIRAEAENGWFGLLPKHVDFVAALVPGILRFRIRGNEEARHGEDRARDPGIETEEYLAIDYGILVKHGAEVSISTRAAVHSHNLEQLKKTLKAQYSTQEEREKVARTYEVRLETDLVRSLLELEKRS